MSAKVLFVLKYRENAWGDNTKEKGKGLSSGLLNSATFVKDMLSNNGVEAKLVQVIDNNSIDREVATYKPTHVIIEALWVVSEKFEILTKLHPNVVWIIRNHSEIPFLANEGIAMKWLLEYIKYPNVIISNNAPRTQEDMKAVITSAFPEWTKEQLNEKVVFLPNFYPDKLNKVSKNKITDTINVGCFGAVRPLKNHLLQAMAAIKYANTHNLKLRFHINGSRVEGNGDPILKNLRCLFEKMIAHELVEHPWLSHDDFVTVCGEMDIGLQVSFSETFNIVAADFVSQNIPVVGSKEIPWLNSLYHADPTDSNSMIEAMERAFALQRYGFSYLNHSKLMKYSKTTTEIWTKYFK